MTRSSSLTNHAKIFVFDLDRTLVTVNSSYSFSQFLYQKGIFSFKERFFCITTYFSYFLTKPSLDSLHEKVFQILFKEKFLSIFAEQVDPFLDILLGKFLNRLVHSELIQAKEAGHEIILLSNSPSFLVAPIAQRLKITRWASTEYSVDQEGRFSGITCLMNGQEKAKRLIHIARELAIPLKQTTVYSDSYEDLPLLCAAGNPIGVNPDRRLRLYCKTNHWKMM